MPAALFIYSKFGRMADYDYLCKSNARMAESVDPAGKNVFLVGVLGHNVGDSLNYALVFAAQARNTDDYLCKSNARMAESVDATVSNTVGATHPGSIPGPGTNND